MERKKLSHRRSLDVSTLSLIIIHRSRRVQCGWDTDSPSKSKQVWRKQRLHQYLWRHILLILSSFTGEEQRFFLFFFPLHLWGRLSWGSSKESSAQVLFRVKMQFLFCFQSLFHVSLSCLFRSFCYSMESSFILLPFFFVCILLVFSTQLYWNVRNGFIVDKRRSEKRLLPLVLLTKWLSMSNDDLLLSFVPCLFLTDFKFSMHHPSMVAAACISTAILGLRRSGSQWHLQQTLLQKLRQLTGIEVVRVLIFLLFIFFRVWQFLHLQQYYCLSTSSSSCIPSLIAG